MYNQVRLIDAHDNPQPCRRCGHPDFYIKSTEKLVRHDRGTTAIVYTCAACGIPHEPHAELPTATAPAEPT